MLIIHVMCPPPTSTTTTDNDTITPISIDYMGYLAMEVVASN